MSNTIIAGTIAFLDAQPVERFTNALWWEHTALPALGLNGENPTELPPELVAHLGTGLKIWQYPNQFGPYLAHIASVAHEIDNYIEIGTRHGGTFIITCEILRRLNPSFTHAVAVDPIPMPPLLSAYGEMRGNMEYQQMKSSDPSFITWVQAHRWGLAFIDGDHSRDGVSLDYMVMRGCADRIVFHDITSDACPDVGAVWRGTAGDGWRRHEWVKQYDSVGGTFMGIGMLEAAHGSR